MSLVEVLVGSALTLLLAGVVYAFLTTCLRVFWLQTTRSNLRTAAALAAARLAGELQTTTALGLSLAGVPQQSMAAALVPIDDVSGQGTLAWQQHAVLYRWTAARRRLLRELWKGPGFSATLPGSIPAARLLELAGSPGGASLCEDVTLFEIEGSSPVRFTLRLQRHAVAGSADETFEITQTVALRNR